MIAPITSDTHNKLFQNTLSATFTTLSLQKHVKEIKENSTHNDAFIISRYKKITCKRLLSHNMAEFKVEKKRAMAEIDVHLSNDFCQESKVVVGMLTQVSLESCFTKGNCRNRIFNP